MNIISAFKEYKEFKKNRPWSFWKFGPGEYRAFTTPPHYAETIEILFFYDMEGDLYIGGQHFTLEGNRVFFVAPNMVHTMNYKACGGAIKTLKINPAQLKELFDIETLLRYHNKEYADLPITFPPKNNIWEMPDVFENTDDVNEILIVIIRFFQALLNHSLNENNFNKASSSLDNELRRIINWTEQNYTKKISLDEVSTKFGYTKHYFCQKFKNATGITYMTYLNNLRISHACRLMKSGKSISEACDECGFEDISYFIQLFKRITGTTPKRYIKELTRE